MPTFVATWWPPRNAWENDGFNYKCKKGITFVGFINEFGFTATFLNDAPAFRCFAFLLLLQFFGGFLSQQQLIKDHGQWKVPGGDSWAYPKLLLSLRCHETLLSLLGLRGLFHTGPNFGPFAVDFRLFPLLFLFFHPNRVKVLFVKKK